YTNIAALYNANVMTPEDQYTSISDSYSQPIGNTNTPQGFIYQSLQIPLDYECYQVRGNVNFNYKAGSGSKAFFKASFAGKTWQKINLRGDSNETHSIWTSVNNNKGLFPISVATEKITSFAMSVELKCRLIASKYSAWQQEAYNEIMRAYNEQLQAYNDAQAVIENTALAIEAEEEK